MRRTAMVWSVKPGRVAEYIDAHVSIPAGLAEEIRAAGIRNYSIYHHPGTDQLFAFFESDGDASPAPGGPEHERWWEERMSTLLVTDSTGAPDSAQLQEVFHQD